MRERDTNYENRHTKIMHCDKTYRRNSKALRLDKSNDTHTEEGNKKPVVAQKWKMKSVR